VSVDTADRPALTPAMPVDALTDYYWLKDELARFCVEHGIPSSGRKLELRDRIERFLRTGEVPRGGGKAASGDRDSAGKLTRDTPVRHYTSDKATRAFFEREIGPHFHFTAHLNTFRKQRKKLTYGDLIREWEAEHERRKDADYKPPIMKSTEYNQFVRDYHADPANDGATLKDVVKAWNAVKQRRGERKYRPRSAD
jgi:SAP domain-containing protein/uncharacterized protein DUF6434